MLAKNGQAKTDGNGGRTWIPSFPFCSAKGAEEKGACRQEGYGVGGGYPFVAPMVESRTPKTFMMKPPIVNGVPVDPWVFRCRVAAVTVGVVMIIALIAALIAIGVRR